MRLLLSLATALVVLTTWVFGARANDPALADKLFREGQALLDAGQPKEACEKFAASMVADPSGGTALNLGKCALEEGKTATAWAKYKQAGELLAAAGDTEREAFALRAVADLTPKLNFITIQAPSIEGLVVKRNGEVVSADELGTRVAVDPGEQRIEASAPDRKPWSRTVPLDGEGQVEIVQIPELELEEAEAPKPGPEPLPPAEEQGMSGLMMGGIIVGAVGVVAVGIGAVLGGLVLADASEARDDDTLCPDDMCSPAGREVIDGAEGMALGSTILFVVGGAAAVGGLVMILLSPSEADGEQPTAQPIIGPGYGGVSVRF